MSSANLACFNCAFIVLQQTSLNAVGNVGVIFQQFNEAQVSDTEFAIAACLMVLQFRRVGTRCFKLEIIYIYTGGKYKTEGRSGTTEVRQSATFADEC